MKIILRVFADFTAMAECRYLNQYELHNRLNQGDMVVGQDGDATIKEVVLDLNVYTLYCNAVLDQQPIEKDVD